MQLTVTFNECNHILSEMRICIFKGNKTASKPTIRQALGNPLVPARILEMQKTHYIQLKITIYHSL